MAAEKGYALQDILTCVFERLIEMDIPGEVMVSAAAISVVINNGIRMSGGGVFVIFSSSSHLTVISFGSIIWY